MLTYDDILLVPQYSEINSRKDVDLSQVLFNEKYEIPIITAPMDTVSGSRMSKFIKDKGGRTCLYRNHVKSEYFDTDFCSIGLNDDKIYESLRDFGIKRFCIDVAHGDQKQVYNKIEKLAKDGNMVIAGNIVTKEATIRMKNSGATFVRVGVGSGAACSTRLMTGHGYPQLSAVEQCSQIPGIGIIADGGIKKPGDIVKALAFGAHLVMIGRMLAGTEHTPGNAINSVDGEQYKVYRGMASKEVNVEMYGELGEHRPAEGESYKVKYKNSEQTEELWQNILGGIRSGLSYSGAKNIQELRDKKQWVQVTANTVMENGIHGK